MGRMITIGVMIASILALSVTGIFYARNVKRDFEEMITQAETICAEQDTPRLVSQSEQMKREWEKREFFLSLYVRHDEIEKMATNLVAMSAYAQNNAFESVNVTLAEMRFMIDHIYRRELPSINNLF